MSDKNIFKYHDGSKEVYGDPLRLMRELYIALGNPDEAFKDSEDGNPRAQNIIVDNAREVFKMVPFNCETGEGATDEDVEAVLDLLWDYLEKKNLASVGLPSS